MGDYISHEQIKGIFWDVLGNPYQYLFDNCPDADVEPVRHGSWLFKESIMDIGDGNIVKCDKCGKITIIPDMEV